MDFLLALLLGMLAGIPIGVVITAWCNVGSSFLEVKLIQILQLMLTILIGVFVVYFVNSLINRDLKKRDIIFGLADTFQNSINEIFSLGNNYIKQPDFEQGRRIKSSFKAASILLGVMKEIRKDKLLKEIVESGKLQNGFLKFKISLTDSPFGEKQPKYSGSDVKDFQDKYEMLLADLFKFKLNIYS